MTEDFSEAVVEEAALDWFRELGYQVIHGPEIAPGEPGAERAAYTDVVLEGQLRSCSTSVASSRPWAAPTTPSAPS